MYTQEIFKQSKKNSKEFFSKAIVKCFFRSVLCLGAVLSVSVYVWVRLLFYDLPFEIFEETALVLRISFTGWGMAAVCIGGFNLLLFIGDNYVQVYKRFIKFLQAEFLHVNNAECLPKNDAPTQAPPTHPGILASLPYSPLYP